MAATSDARTPITMLSGFLGSGKTTLLRYLLENTTERIACIVNDVAAINIDAKLIRNRRSAGDDPSKNTTSDLTDTIELQNGCACCTVQDELFQSFEQLLALGERNGKPYQRIVLENSGVAEPHNLRELFNAAIEMGNPIVRKVKLCTMVTVVDCSSFIKEYASRAPVMARPDLGEGGTMRPVVDLLVEQIECADILILNKTDLLDATSIEQLEAIVTSLNPLAKVYRAQHAKVPLDEVFGSQASQLVAQLNVEGQHRGAVVAARALESLQEGGSTGAGGGAARHGEHKHEHQHHSHHDHGDHDHDHPHDHGDHHDCSECKQGHSHHHHHHSHAARQETTAAKRFGIRNFVYTRRRPFHPQRLRQLVLRWLPVSSNAAVSAEEMPAAALESPVRTVLRSKGFVWMSNSHTTAYYWSHAGQHFEIRDEGDWWVSVPEEEWPADESQCRVILADFDPHTTCGDRRQELVFIGPGMDRDAITKQLDAALLTDEEFVKYEENYASQKDPAHSRYEQLRAKHANNSHAGASN